MVGSLGVNIVSQLISPYIYPFAQLRAFSLVGSQSQVHLGLLVFGHSSNLQAASVDKFV